MTSTKYIGMDVHKESISIAVRNAAGKVVTGTSDASRDAVRAYRELNPFDWARWLPYDAGNLRKTWRTW
jgi:hypothetical protein